MSLLLLLGLASGCVTAGRAAGSKAHAELELGGVRHTVREGETLYRIARTYQRSEAELCEANFIRNPKALKAGDVLVIPGAARVLAVSLKDGSDSSDEGRGANPGPKSPKAAGAVRSAGGASAPRGDGGQPAASASLGKTGLGKASGPLTPPERRLPVEEVRAAPVRSAGAQFDWPVRGVLYARFGKKGREPHDGVDLAAPLGTPVYTAAPGRVLFSGEQKAYGRIVIVDHGEGLVTLYAHNNDLRVKTGQKVREGQVLATVGESGRTSGPHLHFEVRRDGRPVDPLGYLQGKPPRPSASARRGIR